MDSSSWARGIFTRPRRTTAAVARRSSPQAAIPGLPDHLVVTHILRSENFDDPADLARLPAVSRAMRDAMAETGLQFEELDEKRAAELGCLSALQRLQRGGCLSRQEYLCQAAARSGQLEELKVLRENGCPWSRSTCWAAARGGHLEVLKWLRPNGFWALAKRCPWDENTCLGAAKGGHLEVLQWARANGCPWDERTCSLAAGGGHFEMLQWARANGCSWNERAMIGAAQEGHETVVRALIEAGADINKADDDGWTPLYVASENGHTAVVRALIKTGANVNKAVNDGSTPLYIAAEQGHEAVVRSLIEAGVDVNNTDYSGSPPLFIAAQNGQRGGGAGADRVGCGRQQEKG